MLYIDLPDRNEIAQLNGFRGDACVSIYLASTPLSQQAEQARIELGNLAKEAIAQLAENGLAAGALNALKEQFDDLAEDTEFWRLQGNSMAILATPDFMRTYRLANQVSRSVEVSDRFHLKPLLRAVTFPHSALILALSEGQARLVEMHADLPPSEVRVENMPKDATSAVGTASLSSRSASGRIQGSEGRNVLLRQYARRVEAALRQPVAGSGLPLIVAADTRLQGLFRSISRYPQLIEEGIASTPDPMSDGDLATAARAVLDRLYAGEIEQIRDKFHARLGHDRATADLAAAAHAATRGAIDTLLVDMDSDRYGTIDEETGRISFADAPSAQSYGLTDEIAGRALASGAKVLSVRRADLPDPESELAAILRFAI